ncbi:UNVERIFIED_CONTAM: hypothetical protein GTU68_016773 [Idotea baltica]|nr:hypothetical protein [Idotea baltica]
MSAIARYFLKQGISVCGYDKTETALTQQLVAEGAIIHYDEDVTQIPENLDLAVYTPAIPATNAEYVFLKNGSAPFIKRAKALGLITNNKYLIAVAGSHGKTTLTSMIAHVLVDNEYPTTAFIGGICKNFNSNFISTGNRFMVVEADEYDRSFHELTPNLAVITAIDNDHLEIYPTKTDAIHAFKLFVNQVKQEGRLIISTKEEQESVAPSTDTIGYHLTAGGAHYRTENLRIENGAYHFDIKQQACVLNMGGQHNVENSVAAFAVADQLGIPKVKIASSLASFKGIERRFEYLINETNCIYIDDYAHHPEEITRLTQSVKELHPNKKVKLIFQPHLYSRTQKLAAEFANSLSTVDEVVLMDIYPAREKAIEGVTSALIQNELKNVASVIYNINNITDCLTADDELVLTVGAGDIGMCTTQIEKKLTELKEDKSDFSTINEKGNV